MVEAIPWVFGGDNKGSIATRLCEQGASSRRNTPARICGQMGGSRWDVMTYHSEAPLAVATASALTGRYRPSGHRTRGTNRSDGEHGVALPIIGMSGRRRRLRRFTRIRPQSFVALWHSVGAADRLLPDYVFLLCGRHRLPAGDLNEPRLNFLPPWRHQSYPNSCSSKTRWPAAPVQVFRCRHCKTIHGVGRPASEKRQGTKSRWVGHWRAAGSMGN
jgi:hypothetical protein